MRRVRLRPTSERRDRTAQGYRRFRCRDCGREFNERSGGALNRTQYQTMAQHGTSATDVFTSVTKICQDLGPVTPDQLKRQAIFGEMLARVA